MEVVMRSISISTDVFAHLWSLREPGEDTEDAILRRVLKCPLPPESIAVPAVSPQTGGGFYDTRHGVFFPEGFEVFRKYLGNEYRARAIGGRWVLLGDGRLCGSLNELSRAIGAMTENAWVNWFFIDDRGQRRPVSGLRDPSTITSRTKRMEGEMETLESAETPAIHSLHNETKSDGTWRDDVRIALERLRGRASLHRIYKEVESIRRANGRSVPHSLEATIRRTLEDHSSDSHNYRGGPDLFCMPEGKGAGVWALR